MLQEINCFPPVQLAKVAITTNEVAQRRFKHNSSRHIEKDQSQDWKELFNQIFGRAQR